MSTNKPEQTQVPFLDLSRRWRPLQSELEIALKSITESGSILLGPHLEAFEEVFAQFTGYKFCVGVASGTEALRISLAVLNIGPGDEVIVPAMTAVPTAAAVCAVGATPVFADIERDTAALDPNAAAAAVTERTKAVIPVHRYGRPAPLPKLGLPIIEDAAQAHGALTNMDESVATAYSFYPTKNLGGLGDGGAIVTDDPDIADRLRSLRVHGLRKSYVHEFIATNARMSEFEAAALSIGLQHLDAGNARRREIAHRYRAAAPDLQWQADHERHVFHLCVTRISNRDEFCASVPFGTAIQYPLALTQQPAYRRFVQNPCPNAEAWAASCVSLPCYPEMTDDEVDIVAGTLQGVHAV